MEISDFKEIDICNIIKACAESNVHKLQLGELSLEFKPVGIQGADVWSGVTHTPPLPLPGTEVEKVEQIELSPEDKELLDDLDQVQTMMDDPVQFEQGIIDGYMQINNGVVDEEPGHREAQ